MHQSRTIDGNPIRRAFREITSADPLETRSAVLARILVSDDDFSPCAVGIPIFSACLNEILSDPDTYDEELQIRAAYLKFKYIEEINEKFSEGPVLESI